MDDPYINECIQKLRQTFIQDHHPSKKSEADLIYPFLQSEDLLKHAHEADFISEGIYVGKCDVDESDGGESDNESDYYKLAQSDIYFEYEDGERISCKFSEAGDLNSDASDTVLTTLPNNDDDGYGSVKEHPEADNFGKDDIHDKLNGDPFYYLICESEPFIFICDQTHTNDDISIGAQVATLSFSAEVIGACTDKMKAIEFAKKFAKSKASFFHLYL